MYSKEEKAQLKKEFWTAYGRYMAPILSAQGERQNWINYKTGIKHLFFRTQAQQNNAYIGIQIAHPDNELRRLMYAQFELLKNYLHQTLQEEWVWEQSAVDQNQKPIIQIYTEKRSLSIFKKDDWPQLITFFKPRIIALDSFWHDAKDSFEMFS